MVVTADVLGASCTLVISRIHVPTDIVIVLHPYTVIGYIAVSRLEVSEAPLIQILLIRDKVFMSLLNTVEDLLFQV